jgi:hypothetical protein
MSRFFLAAATLGELRTQFLLSLSLLAAAAKQASLAPCGWNSSFFHWLQRSESIQIHPFWPRKGHGLVGARKIRIANIHKAGFGSRANPKLSLDKVWSAINEHGHGIYSKLVSCTLTKRHPHLADHVLFC